jgi:hypothetical protein
MRESLGFAVVFVIRIFFLPTPNRQQHHSFLTIHALQNL